MHPYDVNVTVAADHRMAHRAAAAAYRLSRNERFPEYSDGRGRFPRWSWTEPGLGAEHPGD